MTPLYEDDIFVKTPEDLVAVRESRTYAAMERERAQREARRRLDAETRGPIVPPVIATLREQLARPRLPTTWRLGRWQPTTSRVMLAAQFKAGKSTLVGNLARSLVDGDPWLGCEPVMPVTGTVVLLDFEMSAGRLTDWLGAQRIKADDRVVPIALRGRAASFDITDPNTLAEWAVRLRQLRCVYLVLDCLRPVLDALRLDEHRDAGRFLVAFDALLVDIGPVSPDVVLEAEEHMTAVTMEHARVSRERREAEQTWLKAREVAREKVRVACHQRRRQLVQQLAASLGQAAIINRELAALDNEERQLTGDDTSGWAWQELEAATPLQSTRLSDWTEAARAARLLD